MWVKANLVVVTGVRALLHLEGSAIFTYLDRVTAGHFV